MSWLDRFRRSKTPIANRVGLSEETLGLLRADFEALASLNPDWPEKALRYAVDGEGAEILAELAGRPGAGSALKLLCCRQNCWDIDPQGKRKQFFEKLDCVEPDFLLRLARIYEAASHLEQRHVAPRAVPGYPAWLDIFLLEVTQITKDSYPQRHIKPSVSFVVVEDMLRRVEEHPEILMRAAFPPGERLWAHSSDVMIIHILPGFAEAVLRYREIVLNALEDKSVNRRLYALELLAEYGVPPVPFAEKLVELAVCSSKEVRAKSETFVCQMLETARPLLEEKAQEGSSEERLEGVRLYWKLFGEQGREFLAGRLAQDKSGKVRGLIEELFGASASTRAQKAVQGFDLPPIPEVNPVEPVSSELRDALLRSYEGSCQYRSQHPPRLYATLGDSWVCPVDIRDRANRAAALMEHITADEFQKIGPRDCPLEIEWLGQAWGREILDFLERPDLKPIHAVRFLVAMGRLFLDPRSGELCVCSDDLLTHYRKTHGNKLCFRGLAALLRACGVDDASLGWWRLREHYSFTPLPNFLWSPEEIWPYFAERLSLLEEALDIRPRTRDVPSYETAFMRHSAFEILGAFPRIPQQFLPLLWDVALGSHKGERPLAQRCVEKVPGKEERILDALRSGKQEARTVAAGWLAKLNHREAIPHLKEALKREKMDVPRSAFMDALESLGVPATEFLDLEGLRPEATKMLKAGPPDALMWLPFAELPPVRWKDSGKPLGREILVWLLVQAVKLNSPEPGALLRRYCAQLDPADSRCLGELVLAAWIAQDAHPPLSGSAVRERAETHARTLEGWFESLSKEKLLEKCEAAFGTLCNGSAIKAKGVLAVTAACGAGSATSLVGPFLKEWYGQRASQCRSLVRMLAWMDDPQATQLLLHVANRFRTRSIQQEAMECVRVLAERRGWTVDELADRTIPSAGLDENGTLRIDTGKREFTARLDEDFKWVLTGPDGNEVRSLPDARKDEDEERVKEAKKLFSAAKKELKDVLKMQAERLYSAMCLQRNWKFQDWDAFLHRHPIVGRYCQRLVWAVFDGEKMTLTFRPLDDGTLSGCQDQEVKVSGDALVRLAHDCNTPSEIGQQWRQHFLDYEVAPLFEQFGKPGYALSQANADSTEIRDFEGHIVEAFKLRARATGLQYVRGPTGDGGWFFDYRKSFPSLGLETVIQFSGNRLPEENEPVALVTLYFSPYGQSRPDTDLAEPKLPLKDVPAVLLSECWNDIRQMAAEGNGYDPEWQKKVSP